MSDDYLKRHFERYAQMLQDDEAEDRRFQAMLRAIFSPAIADAIYQEITAEPDEVGT